MRIMSFDDYDTIPNPEKFEKHGNKFEKHGNKFENYKKMYPIMK